MLWFTGFFEGEGCFSIKTHRNLFEVSLQLSQSEKNNGEFVCKMLKNKLGGGVCFHGRDDGKCSMWIWSLCKKRDVVRLMGKILPFCQCRKEEFEQKLTTVKKWINENLLKTCPACKLKFTAEQCNTRYCSRKCYMRDYQKYHLSPKAKEKHRQKSLAYYRKKWQQKKLLLCK